MTDIHNAVVPNNDLQIRAKKIPKVRTTSSTMETFDPERIIQSLIQEAQLNRSNSEIEQLHASKEQK